MDLWAKVWSDPTAGKRCLHWAYHADLQCEWIRDFQARQCPSHTFDIFAVFQALKPWALSLFVFFIGRTNQVKWAFDDCWLKRFCPWKHPLPIGHWWKKVNVEWIEMVSLKATSPCSDFIPSLHSQLGSNSLYHVTSCMDIVTLMALSQSTEIFLVGTLHRNWWTGIHWRNGRKKDIVTSTGARGQLTNSKMQVDL